jgi:glycosyltransferase involved in cell wall biosynthesis
MRLSQLVGRQHDAFRLLIQRVDHVVAVCDWVRDLLLCNGAEKAKLSVCRQGLCCTPPGRHPERTRGASAALQLAFFGRLESCKGVHVVLEALRLIPALNIQFDIFGVVQGRSGEAYAQRIREMASADSRVRLRSTVASNDVPRMMQDYDFVTIPSLWLETGPLVALEAFSAHVPVLASDLGGARELVADGINGRLIEADRPEQWASVIGQFCRDRSLVADLRAGIQEPPGMRQVAEEMNDLYSRMLSSRKAEAIEQVISERYV